jgi:biopolymer transport protein ExbD
MDAMHFSTRKRRQTPTIIIVSLIDVLIVVLIFLMATTTFKQLPAIQLALPESKQAKPGAADNALILSVPKQGPLYLKNDPITMDSLQQRLIEAVRLNPQTTLAIRADTDTPVGLLVKVMDAAKAANIKVASVFTRAAQ